jgi:hypothetical protein
MKIRWLLYDFLAYCCMIAIITCGLLALTQSSLYVWLQNHLITLNPFIGNNIVWIFAFLLLSFGIIQVGLRRKGAGALFVVSLVISLPSLLAFDSIDLLKLFGGKLTITTHLSFTVIVILELILFLGYLLLDALTTIKESKHNLEKRGALKEELIQVHKLSHNYLFLIAGITLSLAVILVAISAAIEDVIAANVFSFNWYLVIIGMICILALSAYLYWLGTGKSKVK